MQALFVLSLVENCEHFKRDRTQGPLIAGKVSIGVRKLVSE